MISVIIPLYNKEKQIVRTLQTVLNQTYSNFEVVVVNDGSTDGSVAQAASVDDARIRIVEQPNSGVAAARNRGIAAAKYDLVALLDADDEWKPAYLQTQMELVEKYPACSVFACNYELHDVAGNVTPTIIRKVPFDGEHGVLSNYFEVASCSHPPICSISILVRKQAIQSIGGFPLGVRSGEDLLTWARLAARYPIAYNRTPLAVFNVEGYNNKEKPKREPATDDIVGRELRKLLDEFHTPGLKGYIAHWHKMRSVIYLRLDRRRKSIHEALTALGYHPLNYKLYLLLILNLLPSRLRPF